MESFGTLSSEQEEIIGPSVAQVVSGCLLSYTFGVYVVAFKDNDYSMSSLTFSVFEIIILKSDNCYILTSSACVAGRLFPLIA